MSNVKLEAAKELIREGKYAEARAILLTIDDPMARQLIDKIDEVTKGQLRPGAGNVSSSVLDQLPIEQQVRGADVLQSLPQTAAPKRGNFLRDIFVGGCLAVIVLAALCVGLVALAPKPATPAPVAAQPTTANISTPTKIIDTSTPGPSATAMQTSTSPPSPVPTQTSTNTPSPLPTSTDTQTPTVSPADIASQTKQAVNDSRTSTADAIGATATFVADYVTIARGELVSYADKHVLDAVKIQGRVFHIIDDSNFQLFLAGSNDAVYVKTRDPLSGIYENDFVTVYAIVEGYATGTNAFGGTVKQPLLDGAVVVK